MSPLREERLDFANAWAEDNLPTLAHPDSRLMRGLKPMDVAIKGIVRTLRDEVLTQTSANMQRHFPNPTCRWHV